MNRNSISSLKAYPITIPIFDIVCFVTNTELKITRVWWQCEFETEGVVDHISSTCANDLWVGAEGVSLRLPTVPWWSDENFFVETQVFHLHCANDCWFGFFNDDVLKRNVVCLQFSSIFVIEKVKFLKRSFLNLKTLQEIQSNNSYLNSR